MKSIKLITKQIMFLLVIFVCTNNIFADKVFGQTKKPFIAIVRDTIISTSEIDEKEIGYNFVDMEAKMIIDNNPVKAVNPDIDTVWTLDTLIAGRRCYITVYSGFAFQYFDKQFLSNMIFLYFPKNINISRVFSGIIYYKSEDADWKYQLKAQ